MAALCAQRHEGRAGNEESKLSIRGGHHLEAAAVQLHGVRGDAHGRAALAGHERRGRSRDLRARQRTCWVRCVEADAVDLGDTGRQVAEEASPHLSVHPLTRGQEAGDLSDALAEAGSVLRQHGWVRVHSSWRGKYKRLH